MQASSDWGRGGAGRIHACDTNRKLWEQVPSVSERRAVDIEHDAMGVTQENTALATCSRKTRNSSAEIG